MEKFEKRMSEYEEEYPAEGGMERFLRDNKVKEWKNVVDLIFHNVDYWFDNIFR